MAVKPCIASIKQNMNSLTQKECMVAQFILSNYELAVGMSISQLADSAGVVKSVVVRFCKSVGFEGYSQFKIALAAELAKNKELNFVPYINPDDTADNVLDKVLSANIKTLHDTMAHIDRKELKAIVENLYNAKNIYIYGVGTSSGIVNDFQYRLMQLGYTAFAFTDISSMRVSTLNIKEGDMAIGISNSGRTVATVETLKLAAQMGAKTACVTSYADSNITKVCDFPLVVFTDEIQYPIEAISARIAHISVLDSIAISLSAKNYDRAIERSAQTRNIINTVRYKK